jgi:acetyl-CoA carboxylase biotin carboxylase subunit
MFKKILIANRGEIAVRVIQACRELGIRTVAIYSVADAQSLPVRLADEKVCVGPPDNALSYRNIPNILSAAEITGAEAIHPGYGFLAESAHFAEVCRSVGIRFIGPTAESIALMGDKAKARELMRSRGIPVLPGSPGVVEEEKEALEVARKIGYPVIIKATAGGGGRGMRVVNTEDDLITAFQTAQAEAKSAFGNGGVYLEKYFLEPRHIEFQIIGDERGRIIHLGERDCSIQRRHQKIVEESPSPVVDEALRREMGTLSVEAARAANYHSVGTIEWLLDKDLRFYFIEMNTRIQVEHPVTEMVTGIDLIKEQIRIAAGDPLEWRQSDVRVRGHAFECRINAECPDTFAPSPGTITRYRPAGGPWVRVDSAVESHTVVSPYYDSLIAKLIVHGGHREEAIRRMLRALDEFIVEGIKTSIPLHKKIFNDPSFQKGRVSTGFLERFLTENKPG